ncbi:MAG: hypothetical protein BGO67_04165 [Alphaproteobacteria bacterium 41-28]|nr:MAG: hypothetical protein BGO67_04165 [Alphaproteobacteria bacterium 41-28]
MKIRTKTLILSSVFIAFGSLESNAGPRGMFEKVDEWMKRWRAPRQAEHIVKKEEAGKKEEVGQEGAGKRTSWCIYKDFKQKVDHTMRAHEFLKAYKAGRDFEKEIQDFPKRWPSQTIMLEISWREDKQDTNNSASSQKIGDERLTEETKVERSTSIFSEKETAMDSFPDLPKPQRSDSELIRIMPELLLELMDSLKQNPLKGSGKGKEKSQPQADQEKSRTSLDGGNSPYLLKGFRSIPTMYKPYYFPAPVKEMFEKNGKKGVIDHSLLSKRKPYDPDAHFFKRQDFGELISFQDDESDNTEMVDTESSFYDSFDTFSFQSLMEDSGEYDPYLTHIGFVKGTSEGKGKDKEKGQ